MDQNIFYLEIKPLGKSNISGHINLSINNQAIELPFGFLSSKKSNKFMNFFLGPEYLWLATLAGL